MVRNGLGMVMCLGLTLLLPAGLRADEPPGLRARGIGYAPPACAGTARGRLMAERAAKIVAARNMAAGIMGAPQPGTFRAYVPGVRTVRVRPTPDGGMEATVESTPVVTWRVREEFIDW